MTKPLCTIVGMGRGVSFSVAKRFAREGYTIAMISRDTNKLSELQKDLIALGFDAHVFIADAADFKNLQRAFREIKETLGDTEVLVYNVSIYREAHPTKLEVDTLISDFKANTAGAVVAVQQVCEAMKQKKKGTILLTGGGQALHPSALLSSLAIGKAAIRNLSFSLHEELKPYGIKVSTITINGQVLPNTKFDPDLISEEFWKNHSTSDFFQREIIYQ